MCIRDSYFCVYILKLSIFSVFKKLNLKYFKAQMLEEMDEEFGISELIDESAPIMPIKREV